MLTSDIALVLFLLRDGKLDRLDAAILAERYERPSIGTALLGKILGRSRRTIRDRLAKHRRIMKRATRL